MLNIKPGLRDCKGDERLVDVVSPTQEGTLFVKTLNKWQPETMEHIRKYREEKRIQAEALANK